MGEALSILTEVDFYVVHCGPCGGTYAILERSRLHHEREGTCWTCPYCEVGWGYDGKGLNAKLKRELAQQKKRTEWAENDAKKESRRADHNEHRRRGEKAAKTRLKTRIACGVCPCCKRTFQNLYRHMRNKHPKYLKPDVES